MWRCVLLAIALVSFTGGAVGLRAQTASDSSYANLAADPLFAGLTLSDSTRVAIGAVRARSVGEAHVVLDSLRAAQARVLGRPADASTVAAVDAQVARYQAALATLLRDERSAMRALVPATEQATYDAHVAADGAGGQP